MLGIDIHFTVKKVNLYYIIMYFRDQKPFIKVLRQKVDRLIRLRFGTKISLIKFFAGELKFEAF